MKLSGLVASYLDRSSKKKQKKMFIFDKQPRYEASGLVIEVIQCICQLHRTILGTPVQTNYLNSLHTCTWSNYKSVSSTAVCSCYWNGTQNHVHTKCLLMPIAVIKAVTSDKARVWLQVSYLTSFVLFFFKNRS